MIDAYEIGVKLVLDDKIIGSLASVQDNFKLVEDAVARTNGMLSETVTLMSRVAASARGMASSWQSAAAAAERMAAAVGGTHAGGGGGGFIPPSGGGYLPSSPDGDGAGRGSSGGALSVIPGSGSSGYQGWGTRGNGYDANFGGDPHFYPGTRLTPSGEPDWRPGAGGGNMPPINLDGGVAPRGGGSFDPMHAMGYIFTAQAGGSILGSAVQGFTAPSFDIADQQANIRNMTPKGMSADDAVAKAMAAAIKIQQNPSNPGISIGQALALIGDTYSVDRDMTEVSAMAPTLAADAWRMSRTKGGDVDVDQIYTLVRSSEELGKLNLKNKDGSINTDKATSFIDQISRLVVNSGGNLTTGGILTMVGQMGPGGTQLSDEALAKAVIASQALGSSQVGTGLNAMTQEFIGGKMSQAAARALHEAGVLPDYMFGPNDGKILGKYKYGIGQVMLPPGVLKDEQLALTDPLDWVKKDLVNEYLNPDGSVKAGDKNKEGLIAALNRDFARIPGMKLAGLGVFNAIVQDRALQNAYDLSSNAHISATDAATPNAQAAGVGAAWNGFLAALGSPLIPGATKGLNMFAGALNSMANTSTAHPVDTMGAEAVSGLGALWLALKGVAGIKPLGNIAKAAGAVADGGASVAADLAGPLAMAAFISKYIADDIKKNPDTFAPPTLGKDGKWYFPGSSPENPTYTHVINGTPLVSPSPTMPNAPTAPNSATTPRMPGAVNRLTGHQ